MQNKIIFVYGAEAVGKTQLVNRLLGESFTADYRATVFFDVQRKERFIFWNYSGKKGVIGASTQHVKTAKQILLVCNLCSQASLLALEEYMQMIQENVSREIPITLIGTHYEEACKEAYELNREDFKVFIARYTGKNPISYQLVSAKTEYGIDALRQHIRQGEVVDNQRMQMGVPSAREVAKQHIDGLAILAQQHHLSGRAQDAVLQLRRCLEGGLASLRPTQYFNEHLQELKTILATLQWTRASFFNSCLNVIALTFACCSVVGIAALWLSGVLDANNNTRGSRFLFFAFGEKQQAQLLIHETCLASVNTF